MLQCCFNFYMNISFNIYLRKISIVYLKLNLELKMRQNRLEFNLNRINCQSEKLLQLPRIYLMSLESMIHYKIKTLLAISFLILFQTGNAVFYKPGFYKQYPELLKNYQLIHFSQCYILHHYAVFNMAQFYFIISFFFYCIKEKTLMPENLNFHSKSCHLFRN